MMKKYIVLIIMLALKYNSVLSQNSLIYTYEMGDMEIILLSELQSDGKTEILIGATADMLEQYIPDGIFPNAVNTFLIKTLKNTILIDTGFGHKLFDNLELLKINPDEINILLITHMHGDHITGMIKDGKAAFPNAKVYIASQEYNYWMNDELMNNLPEGRRKSFNLPREVIEIYKGRIHIFEPNEPGVGFSELLPGIQAVKAYGHTPGHTMYLIESYNNEKFLVWGDLTHAITIQMAYPHISVTYDTDPKQAAESRKKILEYVVKHNIPVAGMHIAYPGMGRIKSIDTGGYIFIPFE